MPCTNLEGVAWLQVIRDLGLQKVRERKAEDDVDEEEGALIWKIHEQVPEDLKKAVYEVQIIALHAVKCSPSLLLAHVPCKEVAVIVATLASTGCFQLQMNSLAPAAAW